MSVSWSCVEFLDDSRIGCQPFRDLFFCDDLECVRRWFIQSNFINRAGVHHFLQSRYFFSLWGAFSFPHRSSGQASPGLDKGCGITFKTTDCDAMNEPLRLWKLALNSSSDPYPNINSLAKTPTKLGIDERTKLKKYKYWFTPVPRLLATSIRRENNKTMFLENPNQICINGEYIRI